MTRLRFNDDRWLSILMGHVWMFGDAERQIVFPPDPPEVIVDRVIRQYDLTHYAYDPEHLIGLVRRLIGMGQKRAWGEFLDTLDPQTTEVEA